MKRNLKLLAAFAVGAALAVFAFWAGGWDFERGSQAALVILVSVAVGAIFAGMANDALEPER